MFLRKIIIALILLTAGLFPASAQAQDICPDISATGPGVERIEGQGLYTFYGTVALVDQPVIALVDATYPVQGLQPLLAPNDGQVIGRMTSDFSTSPFSYSINLAAAPTGLSLDVDQDGEEESGVQMYFVILGQNILNTPFLEQVSQDGILKSIVIDQETQKIQEGALILYAPDEQQGFPCNAGEDGVFFTEDDAIATLPAGYTVARIDGSEVTFDRSEVAAVDINEDPGTETPDYSDQGIVESFESLIDFLRVRYVFNNFYDFDWDALHDEFLPRVQQAEEDDNLGSYYLALYDLAQSIVDAHVYVSPGEGMSSPEATEVVSEYNAYIGGDIGASAIELDDGRVIIASTVADGPAEEVGITFGTEIVSLYGLPLEEAIAQSRYPFFPGSDASQRYRQIQTLLRMIPGTEVEIGYILPDSTEVMTTTLTAVPHISHFSEEMLMPMEYRLVDGYGYVTWPHFLRTGIANHIYADFIKVMNQNHIPGIIMDLRGNGGGSSQLELAVLSYLFSEDDPYSYEGTTEFHYEPATGEWVTKFNDLTVSAPAGSEPYEGEVVYLVDVDCASACEFTGYALQRTGRATIMGQYASVGAGGSTNAVILPGGILFNYTQSTELDDETGMPTFQFVGVVPDVKVPVTEETELAKLAGEDPVLDAAVAYLHGLELEALNFEEAPIGEGMFTTSVPDSWLPSENNVEYSSPDGTSSLAFHEYTLTDDTDPDRMAEAINGQAEKFGEYETESAIWSLYHMPSETDFATLAIATIDGARYTGVVTTSDKTLLEALTLHVLEPALDGFTVVTE